MSGVTLYNTSLYCELCGMLIIVHWDAERKQMVGEHRGSDVSYIDASQRYAIDNCPNLGKLFAPPKAVEVEK